MREDFSSVINRGHYVTKSSAQVVGADIKRETQDQELASESEKFSAGKLERRPQEKQNQKLSQLSNLGSFLEPAMRKSDSIKLDGTCLHQLFLSYFIFNLI